MPDSHPLDALIRRIDRLHSPPEVARKLLQLLKARDFEIGPVTSCLEKDPALAARILRVVNSPRFGGTVRIGSLRQAVARLGQRSLRLLVLTFSVVEGLSRGTAGKRYSEIWRHGLSRAAAASRLAAALPVSLSIPAEDAYTAGLLADVGWLVLLQHERLRYAPLLGTSKSGTDLLSAEQAVFGFDHAMLGARLLEHWGLPANVVRAVAHHHAPQVGSVLDEVVHVGDLLAEVLWIPKSPHVGTVRALLARHGYDTDRLIELANLVRTDVQDAASEFGVDPAGGIDCRELLAEARDLAFETSLESALELDTLDVELGPVP